MVLLTDAMVYVTPLMIIEPVQPTLNRVPDTRPTAVPFVLTTPLPFVVATGAMERAELAMVSAAT